MKPFHLTYLFLLVGTAVLSFMSCHEKKTGDVTHLVDIKGPQENFVTSVNETEIHYTHYGDGSTLVSLVHGWNCDQSYWTHQIDYLKQHYQVITIDLAGHGKSTAGNREDWTMKAFAQDVVNVLKDHSYDQLILVGHSMGTAVVLEAAVNIEHTNLKVVCVDHLKQPLIPLTDEILDPQMAPLKADFKTATSSFIRSTMFAESADSIHKEKIIEDMTDAPAKESIAMIYGLMKANLELPIAVLNERNIATHIINGNHSPTDIEHYKNKGFGIDIIEGTGHFLMLEKPDEFNAIVQAFIKSENS